MRIDGTGLPDRPAYNGKKTSKPSKQSIGRLDSISLQKQSNDDRYIYSSMLQKNRDRNKQILSELMTEFRKLSEQGFYETEEVRQKTSDKIIESSEFKDIVAHWAVNHMSSDKKIEDEDSADKISRIRLKAAAGFYNDPANFGSFADKIMKHFKP